MLFELINKAQLLLSALHEKSKDSMNSETRLYEEMLREQQAKMEILAKEEEDKKRMEIKRKEDQKKQKEDSLDIMDEEKVNKLRAQWLEEREKDESEEEEGPELHKRESEETISDKDLLLVNVLKNLIGLVSKLKGFNSAEVSSCILKELRKMKIMENVETIRLGERKSNGKFEKLVSERLGKYKETISKVGSDNKFGNIMGSLMFGIVNETVQEELFGNNKQEFYMDYSQNPTSGTLFSKTVSTNEENKSVELRLGQKPSQETSSKASTKSRYLTDFEEIASIGKGSFGEVIKARNRLDGRYYAIKKIKIYQGNFQKKIMREVQTLSLMHHQYVLRYYQAWIEEVETEKEKLVIKFICFIAFAIFLGKCDR